MLANESTCTEKQQQKKGTTHSSFDSLFCDLVFNFSALFAVVCCVIILLCACTHLKWSISERSIIPYRFTRTVQSKCRYCYFEIRQNVAFEMHNVYEIRIKCGLLCWSCARWIKYRFFVYYLITFLFQNAMMLFSQFGIVCLLFLGWNGVEQSIEPEINLKMDFLSIIWHARDFILIALKCFRLQINASPKHNHTEEIVVIFIYSKQFNHWNRWQCIYKMINQNTSF